MIAFGVRQLEGRSEGKDQAAPQGLLARLRNHLDRDRFSYRLLRTPQPPSPQHIELFERITKNLRLGSGVYRTTFRGRFHAFDREVTDLLARMFPYAAELRLEDWAASDCLTSAEWAAPLFEAFPNARLRASDLTLFLVEAQLPSGDSYIVEQDGSPLQYLSGPFVVSLNPGESKRVVVNWVIGQRALSRLRSRTWRIPEDWLRSTSTRTKDGAVTLEKIPVIHPEAVMLASRDPRFSIERHSAFDSLPVPVDAVRSMNIFNKAYFNDQRLGEGALAVWRSLKPGGVWIVGRTCQENPPAHDATLFRRTGDGFDAFYRTGKGSEIEPLVLARRWAG